MNNIYGWMDKQIEYVRYPSRKRFERLLFLIWGVGFPVLIFGLFNALFPLFILGVTLILFAIMMGMKLYPKNTFDLFIILSILTGVILFIGTAFAFLELGPHFGMEGGNLLSFLLLGIGIIMLNEREKRHPFKSTLVSIVSIAFVVNLFVSINTNIGILIINFTGETVYFLIMIIILSILLVVKVVWKKS